MGGSAQEWSAALLADVVAGSELQLNLVLTKFAPPAVRVAYEVRIEPMN